MSTPVNSPNPGEGSFLITPSDSADLAIVPRGICFVTAGDIKVTTLANETLVYPSGSHAAGQIHAIRPKRVWSTGTTAAGFVGHY